MEVYTLQVAIETVFMTSIVGFLLGLCPYLFGLGINAIIKIIKKS